MANGLVDPPSDNLGLSAGGGGGGGDNKKRNLIIAGLAAAGLVGIYLFAKSRSSSSSSGTTAAPEVIQPATNQDTAIQGAFNTLSEQNAQILAAETGNASSFTNGLSSAITSIEQAIAGSQGTLLNAISSSGSTASGTPAAQNLPPVNPAQWPTSVAFGSYSPSEFTEIGSVQNGQYNGQEVSGGVPVYASNGFGGLQQGFNLSQLPSGTTLYIPSIYTGYVTK
jgi:hypothetical protein